MVTHARSHNRDPRVAYSMLDIDEADEKRFRSVFTEEDLRHGFDKVFSFYCLHWATNHQQVVKNIHTLLRPGGKAIVVFVAYGSMFDAWDITSQLPTWKPYLQDKIDFVKRFPYHFSEMPLQDYSNLLKYNSFEVNHCRLFPSSMALIPGSEEFFRINRSIDPLLPFIPEDLQQDYMQDLSHILGDPLLDAISNCIVAAFTKPW